MKASIKKFVPVLLSAVMCGSLFAGCTEKPENNDDNQHTEHTYTYADKDADNHTKTCTGCTDVNETEAHKYTDDNDTTCDDCGHVRTITPVASFTGKIYVVGDSTVCSFNDPYYMPRYGYGTQLAEYLDVTSDQIVNLALSGRSSKSFLTEENYTTLKTSITKNDYLIIGFGHNDEKSDDAARFTSPVGDYTVEGSFQKTLYDNYVKLATDKEATPILCTPIVRYSDKSDYTGAKAHITDDGDYAEAIKQLGEATKTTVIDLTDLTKSLYLEDNEAAADFHAHTTYEGADDAKVPAGRDDTHINKYGAKMVAYLFANALKETDCALKTIVKDGITAPTKAADYSSAIDSNFVKPDYTPFDPTSYEANELGGGWYKTAMGDIGGDDKLPTYVIEKSADKFTVGCEKGNGKIASSSDGFAAAFMQIPVTDNFTASVKATVTANIGASNPNQSAFGMMLRDDILVDTNDKTIQSNYVAGGLIPTKGNVFGRFNKAQVISSKSSDTAEVGKSYEITIERVGQIITVTVSGIDPVVFQEDQMDLFARDNNYMYLCLFANRGLLVEFTNFTYTKTGTSQGA